MKRVFVIIPLLAVLILSISFLVGWQISNAQTKVTKEKILSVLGAGPDYFGTLIKAIKEQGVNFEPTVDILKEFKDKGATEELITAIKENAPKSTPSPILVVTATPTPSDTIVATPTPTPKPTPQGSLGALTFDKLVIGLSSTLASMGEKNITLAKQVRQRGVDFNLTLDQEKQLKQLKASPSLIKAIKETGPNVGSLPLNKNLSGIKNSIGMELVLVPAGSFMMGTNIKSKILTSQIDTIDQAEADYYKDLIKQDEGPMRKVTIKDPFYMGKYEVTQAQWESVMGTSLHDVRDRLFPNYHKDKDEFLAGVGPNYPMYYVSWDDAQAFILKLNNIDKEFEYHLPSESQWEYACRAGTTTDYAGRLDELSWNASNSGIKYWANDDEMKSSGLDFVTNKNGAHEVGTKNPNAWGLYDMHGNVMEWCEDAYNSLYEGLPTDGSTAFSGESSKVMRGGSWQTFAEFLRSSYRNKYQPRNLNGVISKTFGFRVVAHRK